MTGKKYRFRAGARIRKNKEVESVLNHGRRLSNDFFVLSWSARENGPAAAPGSSRIALRIPRRFGSAVLRNRAKRLAREIFRHESPRFVRKADLVLTLKSSTDPQAVSLPRMREKFLSLCRQAGLIAAEPA